MRHFHIDMDVPTVVEIPERVLSQALFCGAETESPLLVVGEALLAHGTSVFRFPGGDKASRFLFGESGT